MALGRGLSRRASASGLYKKHDPWSVRQPGWRFKALSSTVADHPKAPPGRRSTWAESLEADKCPGTLLQNSDHDESRFEARHSSAERERGPGLMRRVLGWSGRAAACMFLIVLVVQAYFLFQVSAFRWIDPPSSAYMRSEAIRLAQVSSGVTLRHQWVPYDEISGNAKLAVIAAEDTGFMSHPGIEWDAIERALKVNRESGEIAQGGSTITMQLAKNLFLSSERSYIRKGQEVLIAISMEWLLDKRRILELYLNLVEFGDGVFGIEAAAQHYFKTSAQKLTARQAAWLASILPAPKRYDKNRNSNWIQRKTGIVMRRMPQVQAP